jgi:iron complex outermembrane receptor protein
MTTFKIVHICFLSITVLATNSYAVDVPTQLNAVIINGNQGTHSRADLYETTVSGSRLNIDLIDLPASLDVIDQDLLRQRGARTTLEAIEGAVGTLSGNSPGSPGVHSMRGFSSSDISHLHNGIRITSPGMSTRPLDTFNLERIEVLKGPASVLYGDGALAGAINFVSKKPSKNTVESELYLSHGSFNTRRMGFGSGGTTAVENLFYRVDVSQQNSDGYVDRSGFDYQNYSGTVLYDFGDLEISLEAVFTEDDIESYFGHHEINGELPSRLRKTNFNIENEITEQKSHWLRAIIDWKPNNSLQLKNVVYHYEADRHWRNAEDATVDDTANTFAVTGFFEVIHDQNIVGNRFEVVFNDAFAGMHNQVLLGFDLNQNNFKNTGSNFAFPDIIINPLNPPALVFADGGNTPTMANRKTKANSLSVFIEDQISITDRVILLFGLRHDDIEVNSDDLKGNTFTKDYSEASGRFGATYKLADNLSVYGQHATSIVPVSSLVTLKESRKDFNLAKGKQTEIGIKHSFFDNQGQWTAAIYDISKEDGLTRDPNDPEKRVQIGEQTSQGIEVSLALQVNEQWSFEVNASSLNAELETYNTSSGASLKGNTPENIAEKTANLWLNFQANETWRLGGSTRYVGEREMNDANTAQMDAYSVIDFYISWKTQHLDNVTFRVRNAFDEEYSQWSEYGDAHLLGNPRSYEISLYRKF